MTIKTLKCHLKAVSHFMAKNDIRYYLNGVFVEATPTQTIVVATDGCAVLAVRYETENQTNIPLSFIVPSEVIKSLIESKKGMDDEIRFKPEHHSLAWRVEILTNGAFMERVFMPINAKYVDWRMPLQIESTSGEAAQINPRFLNKFRKAINSVLFCSDGMNGMVVHQNGEGCAIVNCADPNIIGGVMPYKPQERTFSAIPAWAKKIE